MKRIKKPADVELAERIYLSGALFKLHDFYRDRAVDLAESLAHETTPMTEAYRILGERDVCIENMNDLERAMNVIVKILDL